MAGWTKFFATPETIDKGNKAAQDVILALEVSVMVTLFLSDTGHIDISQADGARIFHHNIVILSTHCTRNLGSK